MSVAYVLFRPSTQFCFPQLNAEILKASGQAYLIHLFHEHASGPWRRPFLSHSAVRKHRVYYETHAIHKLTIRYT